MSRNNLERMGAPPSEASPPAMAKEGSPHLAFATPTMFVDLPSKGLFYPEGHPLHNVDQVEIRFMTAKEEDILTSQSLLKKGVAIDRMLQSVIINKSIKLTDMLVGDKNALIIAARISGFGADYAVEITCPSCGEQGEHSFDLDEVGANSWEDFEDLEIERSDNGRFTVTTPRTNTKVELRLLVGEDEKYLAKLTASKKKKKLPETTMTDQLRRVITAVNGDSNRSLIESFINNAPAIDTRYIRGVYKKVVPNIDLKQEYACPNCGFDSEMEVPLTAKFFWAE